MATASDHYHAYQCLTVWSVLITRLVNGCGWRRHLEQISQTRSTHNTLLTASCIVQSLICSVGLRENAGHENAGHENARHENAGHENAGQENAGQENARHKTLLANSSEMRLMFTLQPSLLNRILNDIGQYYNVENTNVVNLKKNRQ